uniref:Peptidase M12A domain-containing protein n=1 Tax=Strongyloides stercoralis TaxID=6248 RepID=A0A0K0DSH8_STRER
MQFPGFLIFIFILPIVNGRKIIKNYEMNSNLSLPYDIYRWKCENEILYKQASLYISQTPNDIDTILNNVRSYIKSFDTHYWICLIISYERMTTFSYPEGDGGEGLCFISVDQLQLILVMAKVHF